MFTAQDPTTLRQAFANLEPNTAYRHLYAAAVARQQADQVYNLGHAPGLGVAASIPGWSEAVRRPRRAA